MTDFTFNPMKTVREWEWMAARANPLWTPKSTGIVVKDGNLEIAAMAVMDNWTETSVQVHMAIDRPIVLRRGFLQEIARYVFTIAGRDILLGTVPGDNAKAIRLNKHIGLDIVHSIKGGFKPGVDYHLMELRRENCRWLPETERSKNG